MTRLAKFLLTLVVLVTALAPLPPAAAAYGDPLIGGEVFAYSFTDKYLDEPFAGQVADASSHGNNGTFESTYVRAIGPTGTKTAVSGTDISAPSSLAQVRGLSSWSVSMWWNTSGGNGELVSFGNMKVLMCKTSCPYGGTPNNAILWWNSTTAVYGWLKVTQGWTHLVAAQSTAGVVVIQDGVTILASDSASLRFQLSSASLVHVGYGMVHDVRFFDHALNGDEIRAVRSLTDHGNAPTADAGPDLAAACVAHQGVVTLDGSASRDPEGMPLNYSWTAPDALHIETPWAAKTSAAFPLGVHVATLTVSDGSNVANDTVRVTVIDGAPPVILSISPSGPGLYAAGTFLAAPTGDTVVIGPVDFVANVTDDCSGVASVRFVADDGANATAHVSPYAFHYAPEGAGVQYRSVAVTATDASGNQAAPVVVRMTMLVANPRGEP